MELRQELLLFNFKKTQLRWVTVEVFLVCQTGCRPWCSPRTCMTDNISLGNIPGSPKKSILRLFPQFVTTMTLTCMQYKMKGWTVLPLHHFLFNQSLPVSPFQLVTVWGKVTSITVTHPHGDHLMAFGVRLGCWNNGGYVSLDKQLVNWWPLF